MQIPSILRFCLGMARHPTQIRLRLRELLRIGASPPREKPVPRNHLPSVTLVKVTASDTSDAARLVDMYARNPSPFLSGPTTHEALEKALLKGIEYYLVLNEAGNAVAAQAFNPKTSQSFQSLTDFSFRGRGYQISATSTFAALKAREGYRELWGNVMRSNTRQQRAFESQGWELMAHPEHEDLIRVRLTLKDPEEE